MKTLIATATLTVMFLSAGAFASDTHSSASTAVVAKPANVTVIVKNQAWPAPGQIQPDPCNGNRCIDI